jgi:hypothetical protein
VLGFAGQMQAMTDAYMKWGRTQAKYRSTVETPDPKVLKIYRIEVVDAFGECSHKCLKIPHVPQILACFFASFP